MRNILAVLLLSCSAFALTPGVTYQTKEGTAASVCITPGTGHALTIYGWEADLIDNSESAQATVEFNVASTTIYERLMQVETGSAGDHLQDGGAFFPYQAAINAQVCISFNQSFTHAVETATMFFASN